MNNKIDWSKLLVTLLLPTALAVIIVVGYIIIFNPKREIYTAETVGKTAPTTITTTATSTPILCTSPTEAKYLEALNLWEKDLTLHMQVLNLQLKALTN